MPKTVLLTGAAGFIGFHTAKALLERGDRVIGIDNLNNYYDVKLKRSRLAILEGYRNFAFIQKDISVPPIRISERIDAICHLAAQAGVRYSIKNPFAYEKSNMLGTLNILEFARHSNVKDVVFASSSSVYGNDKRIPSIESQQLSLPISVYAATKKANELYAHVYHHLFGMNVVGLRFFTVYGPWGRPDMAFFKFTKSILEGKPIDVYNSGNMKRDFTYIDDIVSGVVAALDRASSIGFGIFNLGRGKQVKLSEFIDEIEKSLSRKAIRNDLPMQAGDVLQTYADISKAKKELGYSPKVSVPEGIRKFVEWYKEYYSVRD